MRRLLRTYLPVLLLLLVALLVPVGVVAVWADREVEDTGRYVETMAPLADNPDVQRAVAERLTSETMKKIDLGPFQDGTERLLGEAARSFTGTDAYRTAWNTVNRVTHDAFRDALAAPRGSGDTVSVDLAPVTEELKQQLAADGVPLAGSIPVVHTDIVLVRTDQLDTWRTAHRFLAPAGRWLPPLVLALAALAVLLAVPGRRLHTLAFAGLALTAGALLLALALTITHDVALSHLTAETGAPAAEALYSTVTSPLRSTAWAAGAAGLALAALTWAARWVAGRRGGGGSTGAAGHGSRERAGHAGRGGEEHAGRG
ncbi:hypothetical protein [Streptomyces candidus]|uniref:Integral membrane protein n=1 Tax=Streptomyces candidus TaxID=67283 RepID=A0A7X0HIL2_9ACTN|nr:hypothetical protein [Streptomyces candidus]MBB6438215.1 hypothetical protein [Streptomyces candidus]